MLRYLNSSELSSVLVSKDNGENWDIPDEYTELFISYLYFSVDNTLFAQNFVWDKNKRYCVKSTDNGLTWKRLEFNGEEILSTDICRTRSENLFIINNNDIIRSNDLGESWSVCSEDKSYFGTNFKDVSSIFGDETSDLVYVYGKSIEDQNKLVVSFDAGRTWKDITVNLNDNNFTRIDQIRTTSENECYLLLHEGSTDMSSIVYSIPIPTGCDELAIREASVSISPNPADRNVKIKYNLSAPGNVIIDIYTSAGNPAGSYNTGWKDEGLNNYIVQLSDFPSGTYYYKVRCSGHVIDGSFVVRK